MDPFHRKNWFDMYIVHHGFCAGTIQNVWIILIFIGKFLHFRAFLEGVLTRLILRCTVWNNLFVC